MELKKKYKKNKTINKNFICNFIKKLTRHYLLKKLLTELLRR